MLYAKKARCVNKKTSITRIEMMHLPRSCKVSHLEHGEIKIKIKVDRYRIKYKHLLRYGHFRWMDAVK